MYIFLKVGYEIVRINGLTLTEVTHEEALNLLRLKKNMLTLVVKGTEIVSYYQTFNVFSSYMCYKLLGSFLNKGMCCNNCMSVAFTYTTLRRSEGQIFWKAVADPKRWQSSTRLVSYCDLVLLPRVTLCTENV